MNLPEIIGSVAGVLQFIVAGYALRLSRLFGSARVGWSLCCAFTLLALLHASQSFLSFRADVPLATEVEVTYALISLLLLIGMVHLETVLQERTRMRIELESEVRKKTAYLTRAIEGLQAEIDARRRMEAEVKTTHIELRVVSRQAEMARLATDVLHSVGDMLKSVNVSASLVSDRVKESKIANVVHVGALIRQHAADLGKFMARDPRGQKLPVYIAQLANHLAAEQTELLTELESLKANLEKVMAMQQDFAKLAGVAHTETITTLIQEGLSQRDGEFAVNAIDLEKPEALEIP